MTATLQPDRGDMARRAWTLRYKDNLKVPEIAEELGLPDDSAVTDLILEGGRLLKAERRHRP